MVTSNSVFQYKSLAYIGCVAAAEGYAKGADSDEALHTVGDVVFYRISRWRSQTGSSNNFAWFSDNNVIQNLILGSLSRQFFVAIISDKGQYIFYD